MKKNRVFRLISLVLTTMMLIGMLPAIGVMAAGKDEAIAAIPKEGVTYRIGLMSDTHIDLNVDKPGYSNFKYAAEALEKVGNVDALLWNGDMTYGYNAQTQVGKDNNYVYNGQEVLMPENLYDNLLEAHSQYTADEFTLEGTQNGEEFIPDTTKGKPIVYSMGNHEYMEDDRDATRALAGQQMFTENTGRKPDHITKIGGFTFIVASASDNTCNYAAQEEWVMEQVLAAEVADPSNRPIFYIQHAPITGTVRGSDTGGKNTDEFVDFMKQHPRVVTLSAHVHVPENDPLSIWQNGFTVMQTCQIGGGGLRSDGVSYKIGTDSHGSQCMVMDLIENKEGDEVVSTTIRAYRLNLYSQTMIGEPWEFTIDGNPQHKYGRTNISGNEMSRAIYPDDAKITVLEDTDSTLTFRFPTNPPIDVPEREVNFQDDFVYQYRVAVINTTSGATLENFTVLADYFEVGDDVEESFALTIDKPVGVDFEIRVYGLTPFMNYHSIADLDAMGVTPLKLGYTASGEIVDPEDALKEIMTVNVAKGKTVIAGNPNRTGDSDAAKLVNGVYTEAIPQGAYPEAGTQVALPDGTNVAASTSVSDDWVIVDLGKRYDINEIKLWPRGDGGYAPAYLAYTAIEASNKVSATSWDTLLTTKEIDTGDTNIPAEYGALTIPGNGNAYRYIRIRKTDRYSHNWGELEVFADVTIADISTGKTATSKYDTISDYAAANLIDGNTVNDDGMWYVGGYTLTTDTWENGIPYAVVDLGEDVPLSLLRMYLRRGNYRETGAADYWEVYGFTNAQADTVASADFDPTSGALLATADWNDFPDNCEANEPNTYMQKTLTGGSYRYVVFRKTAFNVQLAEIKLYSEVASNPKVTGYTNEDGKVVLNFSEVMDPATIIADNFTFSDKNAVLSAPVLSEGYDGGYDVTFTVTGEQPDGTVTVSRNVTALNGKKVTGARSIKIGDYNIAIDKTASVLKEDVNVAFSKAVTAFDESDAAVLTDGQRNSSVTGSGEGDWYTIDLGKRYKVSSIKLWPNRNSYSGTDLDGLIVEGSNKADFSKANIIAKTGVTGHNDADAPVVKEVAGEKAYRYIRIKNAAAHTYSIADVEVIADFTATEVSRRKSITASTTDYDEFYNDFKFSADWIVDGLRSGYDSACPWYAEWLTSGNPAGIWASVDLGEDYPVDYIEMWAQNQNPSATLYNSYWGVFGLGSGQEDLHENPLQGTTLIKNTGDSPDYWPSANENGGKPASLRVTTPATAMSRYVVLYKYTHSIGLSEFNANVIHPEAVSAVLNDDGTITIGFSDSMLARTVTNGSITIEGVTLSNGVVSDDGFDVTFDYEGTIEDGTQVVVDETARNIYGIEMASDITVTVGDDEIAEPEEPVVAVVDFALTVNGSAVDYLVEGAAHTATATVTPVEAATLTLYAKSEGENGVTIITKSDSVEAEAGVTVTLTAKDTITPADGDTIELFVWDSNLKPLSLKKSVSKLSAPQEVAAGKKVTSNCDDHEDASWAPASNLVDGITDSDDGMWYVPGYVYPTGWTIGKTPYAIIDLESDMVLSSIDMYLRRGDFAAAYPEEEWDIYGFTNADSAYVASASFDPTTGTLLAEPDPAKFPKNIEANDPNNFLNIKVSGKYRYVVFSKAMFNVQLAEVKIYASK